MARPKKEDQVHDQQGFIPEPRKSKAIPEFDLRNLTGQGLIKAVEALQSLNWNEQYTYEVYKVEVTKAPRYEGVQGSPIDIVAVRIKDFEPVMTTKIEAKTANDLNGIEVLTLKSTGQKVIISAQFTNTNKIYLPKL